MAAVQRKMSIYGRYLPLIAQFSTELAGQKKEPRYQQLLKEEEAEVEEIKEEMAEKSGSPDAEPNSEKIIEQTTIEDYR